MPWAHDRNQCKPSLEEYTLARITPNITDKAPLNKIWLAQFTKHKIEPTGVITNNKQNVTHRSFSSWKYLIQTVKSKIQIHLQNKGKSQKQGRKKVIKIMVWNLYSHLILKLNEVSCFQYKNLQGIWVYFPSKKKKSHILDTFFSIFFKILKELTTKELSGHNLCDGGNQES